MFTTPGKTSLATGGVSSCIARGAEAALQQLTMLITAEGKWVLPDSEEFLAALGDPNPDYDAVGFAIRNLGFVKFQLLDRIVTEIELHPRNVDLRALLALENLLSEAGTNLFRIKYLDREWRSEISSSVEHTLARLRELCAPVFEPRSTERFHAAPLDPRRLSDGYADPTDGLSLLARKWRVSFGQYDDSLMSFAVERGLIDRLMIAEVPHDNDDPVFRFLGNGFGFFDQNFRFKGVGQRLQDFPDKGYGQWLAEFYKAVATSGQPRYDIVSATITNPQDSKPYATHYERLLLPWKTGSNGTLVSLVSKKVSAAPESAPAKLSVADVAPTKSAKSS
jgi:hypothetical protein